MRWYSGGMKYFLFGTICTVVLGITANLIWTTISINLASVTKGPVHYHGDFQIWNCGQKVDIIDPQGLDNKVGTALLHEHNDGRIHVEGPVLDYKDVSLGEFFRVVGGKLERDSLMVPTNNGMVNMGRGIICNGELAEPQVFVYRSEGKTFYQEKLKDPANYFLSPHSSIPPGDCIIIELDRTKDKTERMCTFYEVAIRKGKIHER